MIENIDLAYAAGYIDGDGCFSVRKQRIKSAHKFMAAIYIASTHKITMEWFKEKFGGGITAAKNVPITHKPQYHLCLAIGAKERLLEKCFPFLVEKSQEALCFLKFCRSKSTNIREELILKMKELKHSLNLVSKNHPSEFKPFINMVPPSKEDFAYLAGFIDAECCFYIQRYRSKGSQNFLYKICLSCNNTKAPVFKWLLERFGGWIRFIDRSHMNHRNQLSWMVSSRSLSKLLPKIIPYLKQKKPICEELIKFYKTTLPNGGARHTEAFRSSYARTLIIREDIFHKAQSLNKKGV